MLSFCPSYWYWMRLLFLIIAVNSFGFDICDLSRISELAVKQHTAGRKTAWNSWSNKTKHIIWSFHLCQFSMFAGNRFLVKVFHRTKIFESLEDAIRRPLTGINVLPSFHQSVNRRTPLQNFIPTCSKTLEPSSVFLQLVHLKRVSSTKKTLALFSSVRFLISSLMFTDAREYVKRSQLVLVEFRKR